MLHEGVHLASTVTKLGPECAGVVVVGGSHGGAYAGYLAARSRACAVILNDAGVGKDNAGIGCLDYCDALAMAAATVSHLSARIGDAEDALSSGVISRVNDTARAAGCEAGMPCLDAALALRGAPPPDAAPAYAEARHVAGETAAGFASRVRRFRFRSSSKARTKDRSCCRAPTAGSSPASRISSSGWMPRRHSSTTPESARTAPASPVCRRSTRVHRRRDRGGDERPGRRRALDVRRRHREPCQRNGPHRGHRARHDGSRGSGPHRNMSRRNRSRTFRNPATAGTPTVRSTCDDIMSRIAIHTRRR